MDCFPGRTNICFRISFLDIDLFTLDMAGRIVVGWPGVSAENPAGEEVATDAESTQSAVLFLASRLVIGGEIHLA